MVSHAVQQTYTYYSPEDPTGRVVEDAPLAGHGKVWTLGKYVHPVYPSPLNVRVGNAGINVWMVIQWLRLLENDREALLTRYGSVIDQDDLAAAEWYYGPHKDWIDQKLEEERLED